MRWILRKPANKLMQKQPVRDNAKGKPLLLRLCRILKKYR